MCESRGEVRDTPAGADPVAAGLADWAVRSATLETLVTESAESAHT